MKKLACFFPIPILYVLFLLLSGNIPVKTDNNFRTIPFDSDWRFLKGDLPGAENQAFDDSNWRKIDVPHDWSIEDLPGQNREDIIGPFDKSSVDKMSSGYLIGGIGWYRKILRSKEPIKIESHIFNSMACT